MGQTGDREREREKDKKLIPIPREPGVYFSICKRWLHYPVVNHSRLSCICIKVRLIREELESKRRGRKGQHKHKLCNVFTPFLSLLHPCHFLPVVHPPQTSSHPSTCSSPSISHLCPISSPISAVPREHISSRQFEPSFSEGDR